MRFHAPSTATPETLLISLDEALAILKQSLISSGAPRTEILTAASALGRVLAADVVSPLDVPPHDNSAMDGYALRVADVKEVGTVLPVSQRIAAGSMGQPLQPGTAARIFTGAPVPPGADAVLMQEQTESLDGAVRFLIVPPVGNAIRRRGEDVAVGQVVLPQGTRLTPQALGMVATVGATSVTVYRQPRVGVFSTGDELVMPGEPLRPGAIYNSNRATLSACVQALGARCEDLGLVPDRLEATRTALREAAQNFDLIITSGGVSVGEEDHLKPALAAEGVLHDWQLAIKPGKPLAYGQIQTGEQRCHVMGLPGNPVSSFVTFLLLVRPVLLQLQGLSPAAPLGYSLRADFNWPRADKRREFLRVRRNADGGLDLFPHQGSGVLTSTVWGDGLVDNPPGQTIQSGDLVHYLPYSEFFSGLAT
jgi:molybdopterin molybdotransferase